MYAKSNSFPYQKAEYESTPCNICGKREVETIATKDRNNLLVTTVVCRNCELIFISPRMNKEWYLKYYQNEYRRQGAYYKGLFNKHDIETYYDPEALYHKAKIHGNKIIEEIKEFISPTSVIEVGSSSGGILASFREKYGAKVLGIEPSYDEAEQAEKNGIPTLNTMFEELNEKLPSPDLVLCIRTLNHLLDPNSFIHWANQNLGPDGKLVIEVMNFKSVAKRLGYIRKAVQIDHVFMFTPSSLKTLVEAGGFRILYMNTSKNPAREHVLLVAEKGNDVDKNSNQELKTPALLELEEIKALPDSVVIYFLRYGWKRGIKRLKARLKSFVRDMIFVAR